MFEIIGRNSKEHSMNIIFFDLIKYKVMYKLKSRYKEFVIKKFRKQENRQLFYKNVLTLHRNRIILSR